MPIDTRTLSAGVFTLLLATACDASEGAEGAIQDEIEDLEEAQQEAPQVVKGLQQELEAAKQRVVQLEKKIALAERGVTDDVLEERKELNEALKRHEVEVREELHEAKQEAASLNAASRDAEGVLEETAPPADVQADVRSSAEVTEGSHDVDTVRDEHDVVIERVRGVGTPAEPTPSAAPAAEPSPMEMEPGVEPAD